MVHRTYTGIPRESAVREFEALSPHVAQILALQAECVPFGPDHAAFGVAVFAALDPYVHRLRQLQMRCRPYGRDYLALDIARQSLETAAYHFTRIDAFYGAQGDSAGPLRPRR